VDISIFVAFACPIGDPIAWPKHPERSDFGVVISKELLGGSCPKGNIFLSKTVILALEILLNCSKRGTSIVLDGFNFEGLSLGGLGLEQEHHFDFVLVASKGCKPWNHPRFK